MEREERKKSFCLCFVPSLGVVSLVLTMKGKEIAEGEMSSLKLSKNDSSHVHYPNESLNVCLGAENVKLQRSSNPFEYPSTYDVSSNFRDDCNFLNQLSNVSLGVENVLPYPSVPISQYPSSYGVVSNYRDQSEFSNQSPNVSHVLQGLAVNSSFPDVPSSDFQGFAKRESRLHTDVDAFTRYSHLCARNVRQRCSSNLLQSTDSHSFAPADHSANAINDSDVSSACKMQSTMTYPTQQAFTTIPGSIPSRSTTPYQTTSSKSNVVAIVNTQVVPGPLLDSPSVILRDVMPAQELDLSNTIVQGTSATYDDLGDCDQRCFHCGAAFWYGERLKGHSNRRRPEYHLCCGGGKIYMYPERDPPQYIKELLQNRHFMENIRAYNQMFAMTSFGAKIDDSINTGRGPYVFKLSGQVYHWMSSLCPPIGEAPRFLQLYIYDTHNEVENRMRHFGGLDSSSLDVHIVEGLIQFLDAHNELVQLFRTARDKCREIDIPDFKIRLYNAGGSRGYELPSSNTLGAIVFDSGLTGTTDFDVVIQQKDAPPQRINKLHPSYMSLQFPLLFIYGQPGFHTDLKLTSADGRGKARRVTMLAYYAYQLHHRHDEYNLIFRGGRLFQQYVVGVFCCIEQNRLDFIRKNQNDIRGDYLSGLYDALSRGERHGHEIGGRIILPTSFTGGPRYMYAHYLDALAICRKLGNPKFFITFTCNVNWPEIKRYMAQYPELTAPDRADIVCRIFEQKIKALIAFLKTKQTFGRVTGVLYTVEFQKRGLPHCHTLLWVDSASKIQCAEDVDRFISAELPDPNIDPQGYQIKFPKKYASHTFFDDKGHVHYRRRQTNVYTTKHQYNLDNRYVVPYNRELLLAFQAHINVEYCGWSMLIKYLFKYISKGTDRIFARVSRPIGESSDLAGPSQQPVDEIQNYVEGRFVRNYVHS
ncbi:hypothetical protein OSB04_017646 [Centaurea solstitialis]|uniref:Helitron helicase-like domain-containing protein n=1 Tax=Centaurea solstitialis TaxID=347529 RepID=A0AA38TE91_9ASTR|nr:hypothetical protein OSB04_017646 [Centaurea solstitialis]